MAGAHLILSVNSGSSSLKFSLYRLTANADAWLADGAVERIGEPDGRFWMRTAGRESLAPRRGAFLGHSEAMHTAFDALEGLGLPQPEAVGHRVVHGGPEYSRPQRVDAGLVEALRTLIPLAPLHLPSQIQVMEAIATRSPGLPQVACFDTAFHRSMPTLAKHLPLPRSLWREGLQRYGFHGLSCEYIVSVLADEARGRVIIAHLGNGASLTAVRDRASIDTTMGFTPSGGLMMGTRTGDLDPGVLLYLMNEKGYDARGLEGLVDHQAGLLGVSGISSDMKALLESGDGFAAEAVALFCYQARKHIGALVAVLGGLDTLVFTGGIGEHAAAVRGDICRGLEYLGMRLDTRRNAVDAPIISTQDSACTVRVIPTNEDLMIARHSRDCLSAPAVEAAP